MTTKPGLLASALLGILLLAFAVSVDFPKANGGGFKGDESTYYVLAHSLARDFDFQFERKDLARVWEEFPGPQGIFLKRGKAIDIRGASAFPFVRWVKLEDPQRDTRLYFSKSYIYPLVAAPFVFLFGTNGFLVLHAILIALDLLVTYLFVLALTRSNWVALPMAAAFLGVSVVPVYFVWLVPELFNVSLALYAVFFWAYKEVARERLVAAHSRILAGPASDYVAAALIALATFSKPPHLLLLAPMVLLAARRFQWKRALMILAVCGGVTAGLFAVNAAITGEFNYQGGDRKTFYHYTGFPFANSWETFDNIGPVRGREDLLVGDVLVNTHSNTVFRHNLWYFFVGRNAGLLPYFFPGVLALVLFLFSKEKHAWQWLALATIAAAIVMHLFVWPFTWNGGGGPIGSRYFIAFYALFLVLIPSTVGMGAALVAFVVGALFTAQILMNPFFASTHPGEHTMSGPIRLLPVELPLLHDLPVAQNRDRMRQPLGGTPPVFGYFVDDNSFNPEGERFWVKGRSTAEVVLRAPVAGAGVDRWISKTIARVNVEVRNGAVPNRVTVSTGRESETLDMTPGEVRSLSLGVRSGVPFRRDVQPVSYLYTLTIQTTDGFVPFLHDPCEKPGRCASTDPRFLGAMIHVIPEYTDADVSTWHAPGVDTP
ncbi:MAG TPA: hypothetical protein VJM31_15685 [Vicinamibacterales bacterium]|nr:hypothetical protein [Vicinamibacterales bacterium]